jgi:hypothetical protein
MARAKPETAPTTTPAAAKKAAAPAAKKAAAPKPPAADNGEKKSRRPGGDRGWLAREIDKKLRKANGTVTVRDLANGISNAHGEHPSSGAVAAALLRWQEQGYITLTGERPQAFKGYTKKYASTSLEAFLADQKDNRAKTRATAKAAAAA